MSLPPPRPALVGLAGCLSLLLVGACGSSVGSTGGDGDGKGDDLGDGPNPVEDECTQIEPIELAPAAPPDVLLVVDKSGSMLDDLADGQEKWASMRGALSAVVGEYDGAIDFGLMLYPQGFECQPGTMAADIAADNGAAITSSLNAVDPEGGTPTHTTLSAAQSYFQGQAASDGARYVLLATDGEPNCGGSFGEEPTVSESIAAISSLRSASIDTFVLGFGGTINNYPEILQDMAEAGGTGQYFAANSTAELEAALDAIAVLVGQPSCSFPLDRAPGELDAMSVYQDGTLIALDPQQGWSYDEASNSITFYGASCEDIRVGETEKVTIEFDCDGDACNEPDGCDGDGGDDEDPPCNEPDGCGDGGGDDEDPPCDDPDGCGDGGGDDVP